MRGVASWSGIWSTVGAVSIRTKVVGIAAMCILIASVALVWHDYRDMSIAMSSQLLERGITTATGVAAQSRNLILTGDQFALHTIATNTINSDKDVTYVLIIDAERNVLVHTFDQGIPVDLLGVNKLQAEERYRVQALKTELGIIHDVAVPILGGRAGVVRIGMSEATVKAQISQHIKDSLLWVVIVLIVGLYIAYGLAVFLTKPISQLAQAARTVGTREFRWKPPIWAKDEIGSLGATFNQASEELMRKEEMREQLLGKVITTQEEERRRIARELHDETGQALTIIMMHLAQLRDMLPTETTEAKKRISQSRSLVEKTLNDLRKLIYELRPEVLDQLGLVAALRSYVRTHLQTENIKTKLHFHKLQDRINPEVEVTLFRIIQESITNIIRHSRATMVDINVMVDDLTAIAMIKDNGVGFDVKKALADPESLGLRGVQERVAVFEGQLIIESKAGHGTCLEVTLPLRGT